MQTKFVEVCPLFLKIFHETKPKIKAKSKAKSQSRKGASPTVRTVVKRPAKAKAAPSRRLRGKAAPVAKPRLKRKAADRDSEQAKTRARKVLKTVAAEKESQEVAGSAPAVPSDIDPEDSDFNSSDLDPVLWAVGGQPLAESGKIAQKINLRRENKKKKLRKKAEGQKTAVQRARETCQATPEARSLLARGQA